MDNFSKPKRTFSGAKAIDGFAASTPRQPDIRKQFDTTFTPSANSQQLDDFSRSSANFSYMNNNPDMLDTKAPLESPIDGDKKRRGRRNKSKIKKHRSPFKKFLRAGFFTLLVLALIFGGIAGYGYLKARRVFQGGGGAAALEKNVDPVKLKGEGDGRINVVLLGIGGEGHDGAYLTDTILVASIDPVQNEASLISVPRDLWVKLDGGGSSKINAVYSYGRDASLLKSTDKSAANKAGVATVEKTLVNVLGIPINYSVVVDFSGFKEAVDTVGGIDINVPTQSAVKETLWDEVTRKNYFLNVTPGLQHFDGMRALYYSRSRHTSARGDFDRSERQRQVVSALKDKVQSAGTYANPVKVTQLLSTFGDHVVTDLTINELMRLYDIGKNINNDKVASIGLADEPNVLVTTDSIAGLSVVVPKAGTYDYSAIQSYIRNNVKDAFIKKENASILILNGTSITGLAGKKTAELKSYGYSVIGAADAPSKSYTQSVVIDMRSGQKKYTQNYLEKRFKTTAVTSLPDNNINSQNADFVIILGTDASNN